MRKETLGFMVMCKADHLISRLFLLFCFSVKKMFLMASENQKMIHYMAHTVSLKFFAIRNIFFLNLFLCFHYLKIIFDFKTSIIIEASI